MAALNCSVNSGEVVLVAATAKTCLQLKAPANQRVKLKSLKLMGKQAAGGTDTPVKVRITRSTANYGTAGSSPTPVALDGDDGETVQTTAGANFSIEPTSPTDTGLWYEFSPQTGIIETFFPGMEPIAKGGQSLNIELTSPATPTVLVTAVFEE